MAKHPLNSDDYADDDDGDAERVDDLMDIVAALVDDVQYLLQTAEHRLDPLRVRQIKARIAFLTDGDE